MYTADDVKRFAAAAIGGALESAIDLSCEDGEEIDISDDGLRSQAERFAGDIMNDLREEVLEAIKTIKFKKYITTKIVPCEDNS
jgi:protein involved in sex pheromone biosynthesis